MKSLMRLLAVIALCLGGAVAAYAQQTAAPPPGNRPPPPPDIKLPADIVVLHKVRVGWDRPGDLAFVDLKTGKVVDRVPVGREPHEVAVSTDGKWALTGNTGAGTNPGTTLSLIDLKARKEAHRIDIAPLQSPHGVYYRNGLFYFTAEGSRAVGAYDPEKDHLVWVMGTGEDTTHNLVLNKEGTLLFTANRGSHTVSEFVKDDKGVWRPTVIPVCKGPQGLDLSPDGKTLWAGCRTSNEIAVIDAATKKVVKTFPSLSGQIARVRFLPDGKRVLTADLGRGELTVWDAATYTQIKTFALGSYAEGILISPDAKFAYIGVTTDDNVAEIDLEKLVVTRRLQTGVGPDGMAWIGQR
jgi:DNA-binding beta-propeller fold protein YncE